MWADHRDDDAREVDTSDVSMLAHEERLDVTARPERIGTIRAKKHVETRHYEDHVPRQAEQADVERVAAEDNDAGEIRELEDGSVSVPVLEEEIVITKRMKVRERIIIRKRTLVEQFKVSADLRVEHVDLETDPPELLDEVTSGGGFDRRDSGMRLGHDDLGVGGAELPPAIEQQLDDRADTQTTRAMPVADRELRD